MHDTTYVEFKTSREDLGLTTGKNRFGFAAHSTLVLTEREGLPLGVAHVETLSRAGEKWKKRKKEGKRHHVDPHDANRESLRWLRGVEAIESSSGALDVVHVIDAEGDFFELMAALHDKSARFVIRAGQLDRLVVHNDEAIGLREVVDSIEPRTSRKVELSERKHAPRTCISTRRRHPQRSGRRAKLAIGVTRIVLKKTRYSGLDVAPFELNVVRVWEPNPPRDQPPVEWVLLTTEPCSTLKALKRIVDIYRKRWVIEEYFKALKTGCSLEKRQVESYDALCKVLALFVPIAYRLLLLRSLEREDAQASATCAFAITDLHLMTQAPSNQTLPPPKTIADAMVHLARLGGHIRNNGRPGWQTLAWGYEKLLTMRLGWEAAMAQKCDQS